MHTVYFTRHGQTVWNVENKICGVTDSPLTDLGPTTATASPISSARRSPAPTRPPKSLPPRPACP